MVNLISKANCEHFFAAEVICQAVVTGSRATSGMHQCSIGFGCDLINLGSRQVVKHDLVDMVTVDSNACQLMREMENKRF